MGESGGKIVFASSGRKTTIHGTGRTIQAGKRQVVLAGPLKRLGSTGLMDP